MTRYIYKDGTYRSYADCARAVLRDDVIGFHEWIDDTWSASELLGWISPELTGEEILEDLMDAYIRVVMRHGTKSVDLESYGVRIVEDAPKSTARKQTKSPSRKAPAKRKATTKKPAAKRRSAGARI